MIAEKAWQVSRSSDTRGQKLEQDWGGLLNLAKENGWAKDREEISKFWSSGKKDNQKNIKKNNERMRIAGLSLRFFHKKDRKYVDLDIFRLRLRGRSRVSRTL